MVNLLPEVKSYLEKLYEQPSLTLFSAQEARTRRKIIVNPLNNGRLASVADHQIETRDLQTITVRLYRPKTKPTSIVVYYHGGGWVINDINTCHESCLLLAERLNAIVVSVDYRLAPEYKFPIPVYDCYDALLWVRQSLESLPIFVAGDSAGGNLATVVAALARDASIVLAGQILLYPVTEHTFASRSYEVYEQGYGLDAQLMKWFSAHYISEEERLHPLAAPMWQHLEGLAPAFIIVAEHDVLRDEGLAYAKKLIQAGVYVQEEVAPGLVHSYFTKNDVFPEQIDATIERIKEFANHIVNHQIAI